MHNPQSNTPKLAGVLGFFEAPDALLEATAKVRDSEYKNFDCFAISHIKTGNLDYHRIR